VSNHNGPQERRKSTGGITRQVGFGRDRADAVGEIGDGGRSKFLRFLMPRNNGLRDYTRMEALDRLRGPVRRSEGRHAERRPNRPTDEERMIRLVWATRVLDSNSPPGWATYREAWETYRKVLDVPKR
jgi:hypothetical protein